MEVLTNEVQTCSLEVRPSIPNTGAPGARARVSTSDVEVLTDQAHVSTPKAEARSSEVQESGSKVEKRSSPLEMGTSALGASDSNANRRSSMLFKGMHALRWLIVLPGTPGKTQVRPGWLPVSLM